DPVQWTTVSKPVNAAVTSPPSAVKRIGKAVAEANSRTGEAAFAWAGATVGTRAAISTATQAHIHRSCSAPDRRDSMRSTPLGPRIPEAFPMRNRSVRMVGARDLLLPRWGAACQTDCMKLACGFWSAPAGILRRVPGINEESVDQIERRVERAAFETDHH